MEHPMWYLITVLFKQLEAKNYEYEIVSFPKNMYALNMKWLWLHDTISLILKF